MLKVDQKLLLHDIANIANFAKSAAADSFRRFYVAIVRTQNFETTMYINVSYEVMCPAPKKHMALRCFSLGAFVIFSV